MKLWKLIISCLCLTCAGLQAQNVDLRLDGFNDKITSSYQGITGGSSRTFEFIIQVNSSTDDNMGGVPMTVGGWGKYGSGLHYFYIRLGSLNRIYLDIGTQIMRSDVNMVDGKRHHVAFVYDSSAVKQYRIYIDGTMDTSMSGATLNVGAGNNFILGCDPSNSDFLDGELDEVRLFNYARTDSAIKADMDREFCIMPHGLELYYKLNEGESGADNRSLSTVLDHSGNGRDGNLNTFRLLGNSSNYYYGTVLKGGNTRDTTNALDCDSIVSPSGRFVWTKTGNYRDTIPNSGGCDSIILFRVKIGSSRQSITVNACDSFKSPKANVYRSSGIYTETYTSYTGCDSIVDYQVTVRNSKFSVVPEEACDSFRSSGGKTYFGSGTFNEKFSTWYGCDSVIQYKVKINLSKSTFESMNACDSAFIYGKWYKQNANPYAKFTSYKGCDSIHTVFLNIRQTKHITLNIVACDSFKSPKGTIYYSSGLYSETYKTKAGCDSIVSFQVKINTSYNISRSMAACKSAVIGGKTYTASGLVKYSTISVAGCDSTVNINLSIIAVNTAISLSGNVLTSQQAGGTYQWLDCATMQPIQNATGQSYQAMVDGDYAVVVEWNNCTDTSNCFQYRSNAIGKQTLANAISIQPNPGPGTFRIISPQTLSTIRIYDAAGRLLRYYHAADMNTYDIDTGLPAGTYILEYSFQTGATGHLWLQIQ